MLFIIYVYTFLLFFFINIFIILQKLIMRFFRDSHAEEKLALYGAIDLCNKNPNLIGIVGEKYSFTSVEVALVGELYKV